MSDLRMRSLKVSDEDWEELRRRAESYDESITAYLLRRGLAPEPEAPRSRDLYAIIELSRKIGDLAHDAMHARAVARRKRGSAT